MASLAIQKRKPHYISSPSQLRQLLVGLALACLACGPQGSSRSNPEEQKAFEGSILAQLEDTTDPAKRADLWEDLADFHADNGKIHNQLGVLDTAFAEARQGQNPLREVSLLHRQGRARSSIGDSDGAERAYRQALEIAKQLGDFGATAQSQTHLGRLHHDRGQIELALDLYQAALESARAGRNKEQTAVALSSLGTAHGLMGRFNEAEGFLEQALELFRLDGNLTREAIALTELGWVHFRRGDPEAATPFYHRALKLYDGLPNRLGRAGALDRLGSAYRELGRFDEAREAYQTASELLESGGFLLGLAHTQANLCELFVTWRKADTALELCTEAIEVFRDAGDQHGLAHSLYNSARAKRRGGDLDGAWTLIREAIEIVEGLWSLSPSRTLRASFISTRHIYFEEVVKLLMMRHSETPEAGLAFEALRIIDRYRGRNYLETLLDHRVGEVEASSLFQRETHLREQISEIAFRIDRDHATSSLDNELRELLLRHERVIADLSEMKSARRPERSDWTLSKIQEHLRSRDATLFVYFLAPEESYVWCLTADELRSAAIPGKARVEATAKALRKLLASRRQANAEQLQLAILSLSQDLLAPVSSHLGSHEFIVIPDGILSYIPFGLLKNKVRADGAVAWRSLIEDHHIRYIPAISVEVALAESQPRTRPTNDVLAVFADPVFSTQDPRVAERLDEQETRTEVLPTQLEQTAGIRNWPRLPATKTEAEALLSLLPADQTFLAMGFEATRELVLSGTIDSYSILHFATHSILVDQYPELSGIVLSLADKNGHPLNGFLRSHDVAALSLKTDLVVLSACQTALGGTARGEGIVGLGRAFIEAGTRTVLVSLWDVNDKATAELMRRFYTHLLRDNLPPSSALQRAQASMLTDDTWYAPKHWSGFVLVGGH